MLLPSCPALPLIARAAAIEDDELSKDAIIRRQDRYSKLGAVLRIAITQNATTAEGCEHSCLQLTIFRQAGAVVGQDYSAA